MLSFAQLPYLLLSDTALGFWTALLQQAAPRGESVAKLEKSPLPLDVAGALVDLAGGCVMLKAESNEDKKQRKQSCIPLWPEQYKSLHAANGVLCNGTDTMEWSEWNHHKLRGGWISQ